MNLAQSEDLCSLFQNEDDAVAVETAVRAAVISIMKVFLDVSDKKAKCYQVKLTEVERENLQLKLKLKAAERQLHILQHTTFSGETYEISADLTFSPESSQSSLSTVVDRQEAALPSQNVSSVDACLPATDCKKEEPTYEDTFWIKNEIAEESSVVDFDYHDPRTVSGPSQQQPMSNMSVMSIQRCGACNSLGHSVQEDDTALTSLDRRRLTSNERVRKYRARVRSNPEKYLILKEKDRLRYLRRRKSIADLPEPMKTLKRMAWREASRRHRARKIAQAAFTHT